MFKKKRNQKIAHQVNKLLDEKISVITKDIIDHLEKGVTSASLKQILDEMENNQIDLKDGKKHHYLFETVLRLIANNFNVYLYSTPGTGKTFLAQEIAQTLNLDFYFSGAVLEPYKLTGYKNANGDYIETEFYRCFKHGGLFLFDELDASNPEALIVINAALSNGFLDFPNGRIFAHPNFRIIAAGNTNGIDISNAYSARQQLDLATLERFVFLEMFYDEKLEEKIAKGYFNGKQYYEKFLIARKVIALEKIPLICSTRSLVLGLKLISLNFDWKIAFEMTIFKTALKKVKDRIFNVIETKQKPFLKSNSNTQVTFKKTPISSSSIKSKTNSNTTNTSESINSNITTKKSSKQQNVNPNK